MPMHWWWNSPLGGEAPPPEPPEFTGPDTTLTWANLLREAKDPGDRPEDASVGTNRWASRPTPTAH